MSEVPLYEVAEDVTFGRGALPVNEVRIGLLYRGTSLIRHRDFENGWIFWKQ